MAIIANMLLKNYANVDVTFSPDIVRTGEYAKWADRSSGTFVGTAYASMTRKISTQANGTRKIQLKLVVPTVDGVTGLLKYQSLGLIEVQIPNVATLAEKRELFARLKSLCSHAAVGLAVETDEMPWG